MATMTDRVQKPDADDAAAEASSAGLGSSPSTERTRTLSDEDAAKLWAEFRAGRVARCPRDLGAVALSVDGASKSYRLVCTDCGNASLWFGATPAGIHVRNIDDTLAPGRPDV